MSTESPYDPELMAAVTDLGDALRELLGASVRTTVGAGELAAAAAGARAVSARLAASTRHRDQLPSLDDPVAFRRVYSPVTGVGSAIAPPLRIRRERAGGVVAEATLGSQYEGPPGFLHGGVSGLLMDQLLGAAAMSADRWGMTAHLELDYRAPVPLDTPLLFRAGVSATSGRRTTIAGTIARADRADRALVEARGEFVTPRDELMDSYFGSITDAAGRHAPPGRGATDATALDPDA